MRKIKIRTRKNKVAEATLEYVAERQVFEATENANGFTEQHDDGSPSLLGGNSGLPYLGKHFSGDYRHLLFGWKVDSVSVNTTERHGDPDSFLHIRKRPKRGSTDAVTYLGYNGAPGTSAEGIVTLRITGPKGVPKFRQEEHEIRYGR